MIAVVVSAQTVHNSPEIARSVMNEYYITTMLSISLAFMADHVIGPIV